MPDNENEKWIQLLKGIKFFEEFSSEELKKLLILGKVKKFAMHEYVFREGDTATELYVIIKGKVNVIKKDSHEENRVLSVLEVGDCFGELAFLLDVARQANIMPVVESYIFRINAKLVNALKDGFKGKFYKQLSISLASKLRDFNLTALHSLY